MALDGVEPQALNDAKIIQIFVQGGIGGPGGPGGISGGPGGSAEGARLALSINNGAFPLFSSENGDIPRTKRPHMAHPFQAHSSCGSPTERSHCFRLQMVTFPYQKAPHDSSILGPLLLRLDTDTTRSLDLSEGNFFRHRDVFKWLNPKILDSRNGDHELLQPDSGKGCRREGTTGGVSPEYTASQTTTLEATAHDGRRKPDENRGVVPTFQALYRKLLLLSVCCHSQAEGEKRQSACNGLVQHVALEQYWSASKAWQRDLEPVSSHFKVWLLYCHPPNFGAANTWNFLGSCEDFTMELGM
ncbi:hypothetical protein DFH07DRAFT_777118 [Mycena maculata]|uniref:Uncharacterized protein n=1 Tax=Mycena maculata TaxID=230809 RepID=A0AAD7N330_9AGAR|nr:hypothetical protein DFH07DRAFT_777118 [Mycena maculata]